MARSQYVRKRVACKKATTVWCQSDETNQLKEDLFRKARMEGDVDFLCEWCRCCHRR